MTPRRLVEEGQPATGPVVFLVGAGGKHSKYMCFLQAKNQSPSSPARVSHENLLILQDTRGKFTSLEAVTVSELGGQVPQTQVK